MYVTVETIGSAQYLIARRAEQQEESVFFPELKFDEVVKEGVKYSAYVKGYILGQSTRDYINDDWNAFRPWRFETPWIERMFNKFTQLEGEEVF